MLVQKEAEEGCASEVRDTGRPGASCSRLQALEQLSYELIGSGQVRTVLPLLFSNLFELVMPSNVPAVRYAARLEL